MGITISKTKRHNSNANRFHQRHQEWEWNLKRISRFAWQKHLLLNYRTNKESPFKKTIAVLMGHNLMAFGFSGSNLACFFGSNMSMEKVSFGM